MCLCSLVIEIVSLNIVQPDAELKLKILELQKSGGIRDKRQSNFEKEFRDIIEPEPEKYIDRFGNKIELKESSEEPGKHHLQRNWKQSSEKSVNSKKMWKF